MITFEQAKKQALKQALKDGFDDVAFLKKDGNVFVFSAGFHKIRIQSTGLPPYYLVDEDKKCSFYAGFKYR